MAFDWMAFNSGLNQGMQTGSNILDQVNRFRTRRAINQEWDSARQQSEAQAEGMIGEEVVQQPADALTRTIDESLQNGRQAAAKGGFSAAPATGRPLPQRASVADFLGAGSEQTQTHDPRQYQDVSRYEVAGQRFDDRGQARAKAKQLAPDATEVFLKDGVKRLYENLMRRGLVDEAKGWSEYAEGEEGKRYMRTWADTSRAAQAGDWDKMLDGVVKMYGVANPDTKVLAREINKDAQGQMLGATLRYQTGKAEPASIEVDRDTLLNMGLNGQNPAAMFNTLWSRREGQDKAGRDAKKEAFKAQAKAAADGQQRQHQTGLQQMKGQQAQALESVKNNHAIERLKLSHEQRKTLMQVQSALKRGNDAAEYGKRRNPEDRLQAITMKLLDSGYYDVGSDEGKATLAKAAKHIMDTIDAEGARIRRDGMGAALAGASQEGEEDDFLMY